MIRKNSGGYIIQWELGMYLEDKLRAVRAAIFLFVVESRNALGKVSVPFIGRT